jgi:diaminopimelate decarboxylase
MAPNPPPILSPYVAVAIRNQFGSPVYVYDESTIVSRCQKVMAMPNAFGLDVRYAMKANSNRAILQLIAGQGLGIDASSLNEARRAMLAGIAPNRIMLTTQEVPIGQDRRDLEGFMAEGLIYNVCSLRQLSLLAQGNADASRISVRVNPGVGAGETSTRNTGDHYSSFGIHQNELPRVLEEVRAHRMVIEQVHTHIGSGGDPELWRGNIDRVLEMIERLFPEATVMNLGGGFREARMPDEVAANIQELGAYAERRCREFAERTGRRLKVAVEPGTYIVANAGHVVATVLDKKWSGPEGFEFLILDAGMETNTRPLLYGSRHPFTVISAEGQLLSSEFDPAVSTQAGRVVAGRCCESGDCQTLDEAHEVAPRCMADPAIGDIVVIGGTGAYCASMSLGGYNSHGQAPEVLLRTDGSLLCIRRRQTLEQLTVNELPLSPSGN